MRGFLLLAAIAATAYPVSAQTVANAPAAIAKPVVAKRGATIFDNGATRIGTVLAVRDSGAVVINYRSARITVPAETLSIVDGKLTTSLSRAEVGRLD